MVVNKEPFGLEKPKTLEKWKDKCKYHQRTCELSSLVLSGGDILLETKAVPNALVPQNHGRPVVVG